MDYESIIQDIQTQMFISQESEQSVPPSQQKEDKEILNMIALEINRKGG